MFESEEKIVDVLLQESIAFKRLYDKHMNLKNDVNKANTGDFAVDDLRLERMKKEKLLLKDKMAQMIAAYKKEQALGESLS